MSDSAVLARFSVAGALAIGLLIPTGVASASAMDGWRTGGTGVAERATPPILGHPETAIRWKTKTQSWSNASPVRLGSQICITEEPVSLTCFDADTGQQTWTATNQFRDTLSSAEQSNLPAAIENLAQDRERQTVLQAEMGRLQRELRRSSAAASVQQEYESMMAELDAIATRQEKYRQHVLSDEHGIIGYATPTPAVADGHIYGLFGNGVLSKFNARGERQWSVWLGHPVRPMKGYHTGNAASLLIADGVILAPYGKLRGIDPASGRVLWTGSTYPHYGTPTVANVDGTSVIVTPDGELINPTTGAEMGDPLAAIEFIGPVASGNRVYVVGHTRYHNKPPGAHATAYTLSTASDGRIQATMDWEKALGTDRIYATPLVTDEQIYVVYLPGRLQAFSTQDGSTTSTLSDLPRGSMASPSPTLGGNRLVLSFDIGISRTYETGDELRQLGTLNVERHRSTFLLHGSRIYMRGFQYLYCLE